MNINKIYKKIKLLLLISSIIITQFQFTTTTANAAIILDETYFNYTGNLQTYTIPKSGYYILDVYGGKGGDDTQEFWDNNGSAPIAGVGGYGGHIKSKCYFNAGTILYIYVGKMGNNGATFNGSVTANYNHKPTYNGGGQGMGPNTGDGGGASDIRIGGAALSNRIIVAGGGGGGSHYKVGLPGGAASSGNNDTLGNGTSASSSGGGGGGGYYGGTPGANNATSSKGGSNYFNLAYGQLMKDESGINDGNGYVIITYCQDYSLTINPNGGSYNGSSDIKYYVKNSSSSSVTNFSYTGNAQTYIPSQDGIYKLEVWGAQGGPDGGAIGGLGGYTSAYVSLTTSDKLYIYVGQAGSYSASTYSFNGGGYDVVGNGNGSGGGGTDIRLNGTGNGYNSSTDNRIIVAGGGGGAGGGSPWVNGTAGGSSATTSTKFQGRNQTNSSYNAGGGGGGYYGGAAGSGSAGTSTTGGHGGTNYFNTSYGVLITSQSGQRSGHGYARISYIPSQEIIYTPIREGYTFSGWSINGNGTLSNNIFEYGTGTTTLTANWTKNPTASTLTINPNGGIFENNNKITTYTANSGTTKKISNPTREGYIFKGWIKQNGGTFDSTTGIFTYNENDAILTANWEQITVKLTVNPSSGLWSNGTSVIKEYSSLLSGQKIEIETPTKTGYSLDWKINGEGAYFMENYLVMGNSNVELTAEWEYTKYQITYNLNGAQTNINPSYYTIETDTITLNAPERAGYTFLGWTGSNGTIKQKNVTINTADMSPKTYTANWEPIIYANTYKHYVTGFNGDGNANNGQWYLLTTTIGKKAMDSTFTPDESYALTVPNGCTLQTSYKSNYSNSATKQDITLGTQLTQPSWVLDNEIYYVPTTYTITYNANGGTMPSSYPTTYSVAAGVDLPVPTKKDCDLVGWQDQNGNMYLSINKGTISSMEELYSTFKSRTTGNLTLTAIWTPHKYTIYTYIDKGYGALSEDQKVQMLQNTSIYYYPANGYDVEYIKTGTTNNNLTSEAIDILKVFENVQSDHYVHVAFKITETKKSEITKSTYNWIDLKIN